MTDQAADGVEQGAEQERNENGDNSKVFKKARQGGCDHVGDRSSAQQMEGQKRVRNHIGRTGPQADAGDQAYNQG